MTGGTQVNNTIDRYGFIITLETTPTDRNEVRCVKCYTLFGKNLRGTIEIKCHNCGTLNKFEYQ